MAEILLTHGYFLDEDEKEQQIMRPYPPLGLLYLSAYLKRAGVAVDLYDSTLGSRSELFRRLAHDRPSIVGIYTTLMTRAAVVDIATAARAIGSAVVLGGPESANYPSEYLRHGADVIVIGEGEVTLAEVVEAVGRRGVHRLHDVAGVVFRDETGAVITTPPRPLVADLDALPWPDRAAADIPQYIDIWRRHHGAGSVTLITARGCPYKCNWCSHAVYGVTHRRRSVADCADELAFIRDTYRPDQVWYADDVFTINHRWLYDYDAELKRRGLHVPFETISRADRMGQERVLETLASLGCYRIWIGAESGSQRILDAMERGVTRDEVIWASRAAKRHGIQVGLFLMWGYEGETVDDIAQTIDLVKRAEPDVFFTTVAYPIRNTGYFAKVADRITRSTPWATGSDRDVVLGGRPDRAYYRDVDQWLRHDVAAHRERESDPVGADVHQVQADAARTRVLAAQTGARP